MVGDDYSTVKFNSSIPLDSLFAEKDTNDVPCEKKKLPLYGDNKETKEGGLHCLGATVYAGCGV